MCLQYLKDSWSRLELTIWRHDFVSDWGVGPRSIYRDENISTYLSARSNLSYYLKEFSFFLEKILKCYPLSDQKINLTRNDRKAKGVFSPANFLESSQSSSETWTWTRQLDEV